jgi:tetratricopeptide (TPR) repeat protein
MSKRGDAYLRTLLIHGARSAILAAKNKVDNTNGWLTNLLQRRHPNIAAAIEMSAFDTAFANPVVANGNPTQICWVAPAEEAAGHPDKADAIVKAGRAYVDCYRFRGDILDHRDDWVGAQKAYAEAVALAPELPAGYYSWGVAVARHGDLTDAAAKLRDANQRGPHWADPLKAWGDVLTKQGKVADALEKYDAALKYAPNWKQLKEAREATAKQKT